MQPLSYHLGGLAHRQAVEGYRIKMVRGTISPPQGALAGV